MKAIIIGDIHGKNVWKKIDPDKYDKMIFLGDYCDDFPPTTDTQIFQNLFEIIELKKKLPDKVVLLWGNHEAHYLHEDFGCSGFRVSMKASLHNLLKENEKLFQYAYQEKNVLFTHAGLTTCFIKYLSKHGVELTGPNYADQINEMAQTHNFKLLHAVGYIRGGLDECGGILWEDKSAWLNWFNCLPEGIHQYVGHSKVPSAYSSEWNIPGPDRSIRFCDCLDTVTEFYEVEI